MLLTLKEIKGQLRLDDDFSDEDTLLTLLGNAVQTRTETFLNRTLYATDDDIPDTDTDGLHLPDDIKLGMLLLVTHFYENRSSVSEVEKVELPMSFNWLVGPYRYIPL
ncbi:phage gp6-like head-tail connector protein [Buttiauxella sp. B2]|uniref:head-tail connector protein n=1 Tax=Buttiauxella sp. B2 TaxID=2587812 RepID=UPI0011218B12|nr:head-tail connector protein [Buttiauxella sp. B2]TNV14908.1 phage gp6-like head-tail connector protein [Buttiauxella sp. B2]